MMTKWLPYSDYGAILRVLKKILKKFRKQEGILQSV